MFSKYARLFAVPLLAAMALLAAVAAVGAAGFHGAGTENLHNRHLLLASPGGSAALGSATARDDVSLEYQGNDVFVHNHGDKPIDVSVGWDKFQGDVKVGGGGATWAPLKPHEKALVGKAKEGPYINAYRITQAAYAP